MTYNKELICPQVWSGYAFQMLLGRISKPRQKISSQPATPILVITPTANVLHPLLSWACLRLHLRKTQLTATTFTRVPLSDCQLTSTPAPCCLSSSGPPNLLSVLRCRLWLGGGWIVGQLHPCLPGWANLCFRDTVDFCVTRNGFMLNVAFTIKTCYNYDNFKNQINMKIQYLKPYSKLCFTLHQRNAF